MKKKLLLIVSVLMCGLVLTNCGGGAGSGSSVKLKKNEYLGTLPAIYANYYADVDALEKETEEKGNKLIAGGEKNSDKLMKYMTEQQAKEKALKEKFKADVKAEIAGLVGKEVPVLFSDSLRNSGGLFYNVKDAKLIEKNGELQISFVITANEDFAVASMKGYDYTVYYRLVGEKGTPLLRSVSSVFAVKLAYEALSFKKDEVLNEVTYGFNLGNYAADRVTFSGIEFISKEQYKSAGN